MTKTKNPMGTLDPIELAIAKAAQKLFPDDRRLSADERTRLIQDYGEFTRAAEGIMDLVDEAQRDTVIDRALEVAKEYTNVDDSLRAELRMQRKGQIINLLLLACLTCQTNVNARNQRIERLREEITKTRALLARRAKLASSKTVDGFVQHHARRLWEKNPKRQTSGRGTADEIAKAVNEDLEKSGLRRIGSEAIRKRIREFR